MSSFTLSLSSSFSKKPHRCWVFDADSATVAGMPLQNTNDPHSHRCRLHNLGKGVCVSHSTASAHNVKHALFQQSSLYHVRVVHGVQRSLVPFFNKLLKSAVRFVGVEVFKRNPPTAARQQRTPGSSNRTSSNPLQDVVPASVSRALTCLASTTPETLWT